MLVMLYVLTMTISIYNNKWHNFSLSIIQIKSNEAKDTYVASFQ